MSREDRQPDAMISVRVDGGTAGELRAEAHRVSSSISDVVRRGIERVLEYSRAIRWEQARESGSDEWEIVPDSGHAMPPRKLDMVFGVRLTAEQLHAILPAAEAAGVPLSVFLRDAALSLSAARAEGGTACCPHISLSPVVSAECGTCGPLPVTYRVAA